MLTVREFAKHFDLALLAPNVQEAAVVEACATAAKYQVNSVNVNSCWIDVARRELAGTGVGHSAVIGFPYGKAISKVKYLEVDEMLKAGCSACDMVINVGALKDGNLKLVEDEVKTFADMCNAANCDSKLIFEVGFLSDEEIATLTKICCAHDITYVKTATGTQAFPDMKHVQIMKENLSGNTKIKVSGVPRTFALPATLFMFEHMGVSLCGTRSAGILTQQYEDYLKTIEK